VLRDIGMLDADRFNGSAVIDNAIKKMVFFIVRLVNNMNSLCLPALPKIPACRIITGGLDVQNSYVAKAPGTFYGVFYGWLN
jgi:hypothetical protein